METMGGQNTIASKTCRSLPDDQQMKRHPLRTIATDKKKKDRMREQIGMKSPKGE